MPRGSATRCSVGHSASGVPHGNGISRESGLAETKRGTRQSLPCPGKRRAGYEDGRGQTQLLGPADPATYVSIGTVPAAQALRTGVTILQQSSATSPRTLSSGSPARMCDRISPVSYTHLTLPTNREV